MSFRCLCDRFDALVSATDAAIVALAFLALLLGWELAARRKR